MATGCTSEVKHLHSMRPFTQDATPFLKNRGTRRTCPTQHYQTTGVQETHSRHIPGCPTEENYCILGWVTRQVVENRIPLPVATRRRGSED
jgi:hypothetical protein